MLETVHSSAPISEIAETAVVTLEPQLEFQQAQREAIVDLLLLGMHVDQTISLMESDLLEAEIATLDWDEFYSPDIYLQRAVPIVRDAIGNITKQATLLRSISDRLVDAEVKKDAIERFSTMLAIDGTAAAEEQLLDQAMSILVGS